MDVPLLLTLLIVILSLLFVLALIFPARFTAWGGSNSHRGKAFYYLIAAFGLLMWLGTMADDIRRKEILDAPLEVRDLTISEEELTAFPDYLDQLANLEELNLSFNNITTIDENIKGLKKLRWLLLDHNPISTVPEWVADFQQLEILSLHNTNIDSAALPMLEQLRARGVRVDYEETFITGKSDDGTSSESEATAQEAAETDTDDPHAESFAEFAKRRLLGGRDTEHRRIYGKGEIFYKSGIEHAMLDSLGYALTDVGLFGEDKQVSARLILEGDLYQLKIVTVYEQKADITPEDRAAWQLIGVLVAARVFEGKTMELYVCDVNWKVLDKIDLE